jgi:hypothetical protein
MICLSSPAILEQKKPADAYQRDRDDLGRVKSGLAHDLDFLDQCQCYRADPVGYAQLCGIFDL